MRKIKSIDKRGYIDFEPTTTATQTTSQAQAIAIFFDLPLAEVEKVLGVNKKRKTKKVKK